MSMLVLKQANATRKIQGKPWSSRRNHFDDDGERQIFQTIAIGLRENTARYAELKITRRRQSHPRPP